MTSVRRLTLWFLAFIVLSAGFLDYWAYSVEFYKNPGTYLDVLQGTAAAPAQYRVAVVYAASFIAHHGHMQLRHAMALIDVVTAFLAGCILLRLIEKSQVFRSRSRVQHLLASATFLFLVTYYLIWITWYQRPETLATALMVALMLLLLRARPTSTLQSASIVLGMIAITALQSFIRADVAFGMQAGFFLFCLLPVARGLSLPRTVQAVTSAICVVLALGVQYWLMHKVYPQASYGSTPVFQLKLNLKDHLRLFPFLFFVAPWACTVYAVVKKKFTQDAGSLALLCSSCVFMVMWWTVGKIDEVRIFLPFAMALIPLSAQMILLEAGESAS